MKSQISIHDVIFAKQIASIHDVERQIIKNLDTNPANIGFLKQKAISFLSV